MQDSMNREWDEQFVDSAWGNMRQLLDQELPVAKSRGRRRWIFLLILFFFLGLALGGASFYMTNSPVIEYFPIPQRAVALQSQPDQTLPQNQQLTDNLRSEETPAKLPVSNNTDHSIVESSFPILHKEKKSKSSTTAVVTSTEGEHRIQIAEDINLIQQETAPAKKEELTLEETSNVIAPDVPKEKPFLPIEQLQALSKNDLESVVSIQQDIPGLSLPAAMAKSSSGSRFDWGAEVGGNYYEGPGYFGGLQVNYYLGHRWGLQSGLYYGQTLSGLSNTRKALDEAKALESAQRQPDSGLVNNLDQQKASSAVDYYNVDIKLQQLTTPILLTYQLSPKWELGAGVQLHYLLKAKRPAQNTAADQNYAAGLNFSSYDRQITGVAAPGNSIDPQLFKKWNMGATFGVGFRPVDRWSVHLRYEYGLFNWLEADRFFIAPTNLQLSAVYRLSK